VEALSERFVQCFQARETAEAAAREANLAHYRAHQALLSKSRPSDGLSRDNLIALQLAWGDLTQGEADRMSTADLAVRYDREVMRHPDGGPA
jgi:hypothetical protein